MSEKRQHPQIRVQLGEYESKLVGIMATLNNMSIADMVNKCVKDCAPEHTKQYLEGVQRKPELPEKDDVETFYDEADKIPADEEPQEFGNKSTLISTTVVGKLPEIDRSEQDLKTSECVEEKAHIVAPVPHEETQFEGKIVIGGATPKDSSMQEKYSLMSEEELRDMIDNEIPLEKDHATIELIRRYKNKGVSIREMARALGRGRDTISNYLKQQA